MGTLRFTLRTDKPDQDNICPIRLIYQIAGQRRYYNTGEKLLPELWDSSAQRGIFLSKKEAKRVLPQIQYDSLPTARDIDDLNDNLTSIKRDVLNIENRFKLNKVVYSPEMVLAELKEMRSPETKKEAPSNQLFDFIDNYIQDHLTTREPGSLTVYKSLKKHLQDYQEYKRIKVTFENIDYGFFNDFQNYLITRKNLSNTTVAKQLSTAKTFLNYARLRGIKVSDKYKDFKVKKESLEVIALTNEEFETLYNLDLTDSVRLDQVRDVFCFSCSTGLRFSDLAQLKREHIKGDEIRLTVKKTKQRLTVPLTPYSKTILDKYRSFAKPLPVISNQKTNDYLKELCKKAEINDPVEIVRFKGSKREANIYPKHQLISIHTGRKTFCTLSLERGMNAEEVMQITGHKDYQSFKRYVNITEQRSKVVMRTAWGEVKKSDLKAV